MAPFHSLCLGFKTCLIPPGLLPLQELTADDLFKANILGWCLELVGAGGDALLSLSHLVCALV